MKRLFDIVVSGLGILVFLPVGLLIGLVLRFSGEGEVFYVQKRVGRNGKKFGLLKYATMLKDSPNLGTGTITQRNDPRVLPIGRFLRKTKLNEVPQLWNIFVGDMSIVGPRPVTKEHFEFVPDEMRSQIKGLQPGLTGIGSIIFRDEETMIHNSGEDPREFYRREIAPFKGELEVWYKQRRSLILDLKIIFVTAWVVILPSSDMVRRFFPDLPVHELFNPK